MKNFNSGVRLSADRQLRAKASTSDDVPGGEGRPRDLRVDEWSVGIGNDVVVKFVHVTETNSHVSWDGSFG